MSDEAESAEHNGDICPRMPTKPRAIMNEKTVLFLWNYSIKRMYPLPGIRCPFSLCGARRTRSGRLPRRSSVTLKDCRKQQIVAQQYHRQKGKDKYIGRKDHNCSLKSKHVFAIVKCNLHIWMFYSLNFVWYELSIRDFAISQYFSSISIPM